MTSGLIDDCFRQDPRDGARLAHHRVLEQLRARVHPIVGVDSVAIDNAAGHVAAGAVAAQRAVPGHTNAAVDGFAFAHAGLDLDGATALNVVGRAAAGHPFAAAVAPGQAVRIFTGAMVPAGCDTVAMQEDCTVSGDRVSVPPGLRLAANVRRAGEDVDVGDVIVGAGDTIRPQDIAALASLGVARIDCFVRPKVAIVSSGDEILRVGAGALKPGQVFDSNAPLLTTLAEAAGCDVVDLGVLTDEPSTIIAKLEHAAKHFDVVLTTGGASQGDEDHMARAIDTLGTRHFWQIAVKPGRPLMFGQIAATTIVGLPGNPVAVFVCFLMYVRPLLRRLGGAHWPEPARYRLPATFTIAERKTGRREFWRGRTRLIDGQLGVEKFPKDGSGLISGLRFANGLIDVEEDTVSIKSGDLVNFIPLTEFGIHDK